MVLGALFTVILLGAPAKPEGPVAVLPFKNLNGEATLSWLERGISETMVTDLRKSGRMVVVERDQIEQAMAEIALQGTKLAEETSAVRAGKLVGARTVVVGSFQKAGTDLRINARFVAVETGVILDTAKETGPITKVFTLQDHIVDRLLGIPKGAPPPKRPPRSGTEKSVESYRLYAQALETRSDADRESLLRRSIEVDPDFIYAIEDLAALQKRIEGYARTSRKKLAEQDAKRLDVLDDRAASPAARSEAAVALMASLERAKRYTLLVEIAERVLALRLPPTASGLDPSEHASAHRIRAWQRLRKWDLALQYGEKHLLEFPAGGRFSEVQSAMESMIAQRQKWSERRPEYEADLAEKRSDLPATRDAEQQAAWDFAPCIASHWTSQENELMLDGCRNFVEKHAKNPAADPDNLSTARYDVIRALASLGRFNEARPLAEALIADSDDWDKELAALMREWPED